MLPFDLETGKTYRLFCGDLVEIVGHPTIGIFVGYFAEKEEVAAYSPRGILRGIEDEKHPLNIAMPAETWGVYHVSDGDYTQGDTHLKKALERWQGLGGVIETLEDIGLGMWEVATCKVSFCDDNLLYRAAGCTQTRTFPKRLKPVVETPPLPPPDRIVTCRDMVDYTKFIIEGKNPSWRDCIKWWEQRATEQTEAAPLPPLPPPPPGPQKCPRCRGKGWNWQGTERNPGPDSPMFQDPCTYCKGKGVVPSES